MCRHLHNSNDDENHTSFNIQLMIGPICFSIFQMSLSTPVLARRIRPIRSKLTLLCHFDFTNTAHSKFALTSLTLHYSFKQLKLEATKS